MDRLHTRATWIVGRAHARGHALLQKALAAAGSRPYHYRVLAALEEHGSPSQAQVGRIAGLDRSDVTGSLDALCERGFAVREADPSDRRRNVVTLTEAGGAELRRLDEVLDDVQARFLAPLSSQEHDVMLELMARLADGGPRTDRP